MTNVVGLSLLTLALSIEPVWAIEPGWAARACQALSTIDAGAHMVEWSARTPRRAAGPHADPPDDDDTDDEEEDRRALHGRAGKRKDPLYRITDGVAHIYICGPMTKRPQSWGSGTSTVMVRRAIRAAGVDDAVKAILLILDSPGDQVSGTSDLARDVAMVSRQKPVASYAQDQCCSAAYWVASQAGYGLFCNETATVGSLGVITVLEDSSAAAEQEGRKVHVVATGDLKGVGAPGAPVTEAHLAYLQTYVYAINAEFRDAVRVSRRVDDARMAELQRAGMYVGLGACAAGLVDAVKSLDDVHSMLVGSGGNPAARFIPLQEGQPASVPEPPKRQEVVPGSVHLVPGSNVVLVEDGSQVTISAGNVVDDMRPAIMPPSPGQRPASAVGEKSMKAKLVRALTMLGLSKMAVGVVNSQDDTAEGMATAMSAQVNAEVEERIAKHDLILQCGAVGIKTAAFNDMAILGRAHLAQLRTDAKAQAVRAFGGEVGPHISAQVDHMPAGQVKSLLNAWLAQADATYGIGKDGAAADRKSAPKVLPESLNATEGASDANQNKSAWDRLKPEHRAYGEQLLGRDASAEQKEAFAVQAIKDLGE
jgi:ClpP class serine protease